MITKDKQVEILEDTIDIINKGWCTGELKKSTPKGDRHCTLGALTVACDLGFWKYGDGPDDFEIETPNYYEARKQDVPRRVERGYKRFEEMELILNNNLELAPAPSDGGNTWYGVAQFNDHQKDRRVVTRWLKRIINKIQNDS